MTPGPERSSPSDAARDVLQAGASYWLLYLCTGSTARRGVVDTGLAYSSHYQWSWPVSSP